MNSISFGKEIGKRMRSARKKARKTLQQAGEHVKVSRMTISRWEAGTSSPEIDQAYNLSFLYRVPFSVMIFGERPGMLDVSRLWPHTQNALKRHVERLAVSQQMVEAHWPDTVERIRSSAGPVDPPWR